jgi:glycosyltransferase involved in cell wall biosynthesis
MSTDRARQGWSVPDLGAAEVVLAPDAPTTLSLLEGSSETVHLLQGWRGCKFSTAVIQHARRENRRVGVIAESGDSRGLAGVLRSWRYRADIRASRKTVDFILAMGALGTEWYRKCGAAGEGIFPFGYVVERPGCVEEETGHPTLRSEFRLLYLGQFIERKGVDVLLAALAGCARLLWRADLVGDGPLKARCLATAHALGLSDRVHFVPAQEHPAAMKRLAQTDLLVLPSLYDGWGAVVNEALMRGIPVICTSACGASDLIRHSGLGSVVASSSVEELRRALTEWITRGPRTAALSNKILAWSRCIEGESVAAYFLSVLDHVYEGGPRPVAPWRIEAQARVALEADAGMTCACDRFGTSSCSPGLDK